MDKLKAQLAPVLKYSFWIASALVLLGSLGVWYMTTSSLVQESDVKTRKINDAIQTVSSVQSKLQSHPNQVSHEEMNRLIEARQDQVLKSWETLYDRQRDILTWPTEKLTQDFVDEFKDLIPIEVHIAFPTPEKDEKKSYLLIQYARYIQNYLPEIAKIAKAEWTAAFDTSSSSSSSESLEYRSRDTDEFNLPKEGPLVRWSSASQQELLADLFPWRGNQPTTLEVYYSQENLWILRQLMQIIDDVNGSARQRYQAKIHEIKQINIGRSVLFGAGEIASPNVTTTAMDGSGMEFDSGMMDSMGGPMGDSGMGLEMADPADNRYVGVDLRPINGSELRSALNSNQPGDVSLAIAKRVPVMMSLQMDQRAVADLLAACGSAPLMVEVNQVRVLGHGSSAQASSSLESTEWAGSRGSSGLDSSTTTTEEFPLDMNVEVYGLIYIYNPPDPVKLAIEKVTQETIKEDTIKTPVTPTPTPVTPDAESEDVLPVPRAEPSVEAPAAPDGGVSDTPPAEPAVPPAAAPPGEAAAAGAAPAEGE